MPYFSAIRTRAALCALGSCDEIEGCHISEGFQHALVQRLGTNFSCTARTSA